MSDASVPLLIYDGKCGFCRIWIDYWKRLTGDQVRYAPSQEVGDQYPQIPREAFAQAVQLVRPDGSVVSGARAVFETLGYEGFYERHPRFASISEGIYRFIAEHRSFFYQVTRFTFGRQIEPARFGLTQWLFLRLLAIIYAIAFGSLGVQVMGLLGSRGIAPAHDFLQSVGAQLGPMRYYAIPSLFWIHSSDAFLKAGCWVGAIFALLLWAGYFERLMLALLYLLYLSYCLAGQDFLSFQWDALLLEAGFLAIFFGKTLQTQRTVAWLFRWLVFRLYFLSGVVKLASGDPTWRNLSALDFHYYTQPLPTIFAWYADKLPRSFHHASTFAVLAVELVAPFLIFGPRRIRMFGAALLLALQTLIFLTGNYTFFNVLTAALTLFLFDDQALRKWFQPSPEPPSASRRIRMATVALTIVLLPLGLLRIAEAFIADMPSPIQTVSRLPAPFQIVNSYGLFAVMTTQRLEIEVQGSDDGVEWKVYEFRYKPGDVNRAPRWAAPYQPRLDWQMWFAALGQYNSNSWFLSFATRLLQGSPDVLDLLASNPFPTHPPKYIRALSYDYRFSSKSEHDATGAWWHRELKGEYLPAIGFKTAAVEQR